MLWCSLVRLEAEGLIPDRRTDPSGPALSHATPALMGMPTHTHTHTHCLTLLSEGEREGGGESVREREEER